MKLLVRRACSKAHLQDYNQVSWLCHITIFSYIRTLKIIISFASNQIKYDFDFIDEQYSEFTKTEETEICTPRHCKRPPYNLINTGMSWKRALQTCRETAANTGANCINIRKPAYNPYYCALWKCRGGTVQTSRVAGYGNKFKVYGCQP